MKHSKKIPYRTCIGCQSKRPKKELLRIIKTPEGNIEIDVTGKKSGRGAYLCYNKECFEKAAKKGKLNNALKVEISPETIKLLKEKFNELKNTSL